MLQADIAIGWRFLFGYRRLDRRLWETTSVEEVYDTSFSIHAVLVFSPLILRTPQLARPAALFCCRSSN
jgi:hypothetical protein